MSRPVMWERRVQFTGKSTFVVSLPKEWARRVGLKRGDSVAMVLQPDGSLLLTPKEVRAMGEPAPIAHLIASSSKSPEEVAREFIGFYLAGWDMIKVKLKDAGPEHRRHLKDIIRRMLVGVEVLEESAGHLTSQCIIGYAELPLDRVLRRMHILSLSMFDDAIQALRTCNPTLAREIVERDDEVDRLYLFAIRELARATRNPLLIREIGLLSPCDTLDYRLIMKNLERIADHAVRIARVTPIGEAVAKNIVESICGMADRAREVFETAMRSFYRLDTELAHQALREFQDILDFEDKAEKQIIKAELSTLSIINLSLVLESVRRIAEYSTDIAEIAINIAAKRFQTNRFG